MRTCSNDLARTPHSPFDINGMYLLYKAEKPSVCLFIGLSVRPFVCLHFWHANNSAVSALIEMGLAQNESCVFGGRQSLF